MPSNPKNDIFANLLQSSTRKSFNKNSSMGMAQQMKLSSSSLSNIARNDSSTASIDMDFLETHLKGNGSRNSIFNTQPLKPQPSSTHKGTVNDIFASFTTPSSRSQSSLPSNGNSSKIASSSQPNPVVTNLGIPTNDHQTVNKDNTDVNNGITADNGGMDLLEGFFTPVSTPNKSETSLQHKTENNNSNSTHLPIHADLGSQRDSQKQQIDEKKDDALAVLMDMGFDIDEASRALNQTSSGYNVESALNMLTLKDSNDRRRYDHESLPNNLKVSNSESLGEVVNDLSSEFMSKASRLFKSGREKLQQGIEMYKQQQNERTGNEPAWMKNRDVYKKKSIGLMDERDELTRDHIRRLTAGQRAKDREFRLGRDHVMSDFGKADEYSGYKPSNYDSFNSSRSQSVERTPEIGQQERRSHTQQQVGVQSMQHKSTLLPRKNSENDRSKSPDETLVDIMEAPLSTTSNGVSSTKSRTPGGLIPYNKPSMPFGIAREEGAAAFKSGDFPQALECYQEALQFLSTDHPFRILMYSNLATVFEKLGNSRDQLSACTSGLDMISTLCKDVSLLDDLMLEPHKSLKKFWIKLNIRRAEALEQLEKFQDSFKVYDELLKHGVSSKPIMDGRRRCLSVMQPKRKPAVERPVSATHRLSNSTVTPKLYRESETLRRVKRQEDAEEKEKEEMFRLHDKVEGLLQGWSNGKTDNIRALLSSLHEILWPDLHWRPVSMTDLVLDKKVKITYLKAVAKVHPDKLGNNVTTEQKMIANGVFITINEAWETYKKMNNIK